MPAVVSYPNELPFTGNYQSFRAPLLLPPSEGPRSTPMSAAWLTDARAPNYALDVNFAAARNVQEFSQIAALYVDNLGCDADAVFFFPDTQFRLDVPARSIGLFPVITNALRFIAACPNATDGDATVWQVLNFNPPPVAVAKTFFAEAANIDGGALPTGGGADVAVPIVNGPGTLAGLQLYLRGAMASVADAIRFYIVDAFTTPTTASPQLLFRSLTIPTTAADFVVLNLSGMDVRVVNGVSLVMHQIGTAVISGVADCNVQFSVT